MISRGQARDGFLEEVAQTGIVKEGFTKVTVRRRGESKVGKLMVRSRNKAWKGIWAHQEASAAQLYTRIGLEEPRLERRVEGSSGNQIVGEGTRGRSTGEAST